MLDGDIFVTLLMSLSVCLQDFLRENCKASYRQECEMIFKSGRDVESAIGSVDFLFQLSFELGEIRWHPLMATYRMR